MQISNYKTVIIEKLNSLPTSKLFNICNRYGLIVSNNILDRSQMINLIDSEIYLGNIVFDDINV